MRLKYLLYQSVFALLAFNTAITPHTWSLVRIEDVANNRTLVPNAEKPLMRFTKEHVYLKGCTEVSGRYSFVRAFQLQVDLDSIKDQHCVLADRQINWYFKYRLKELVYILLDDTLQMRDKSGVNFVFAKDAPKK